MNIIISYKFKRCVICQKKYTCKVWYVSRESQCMAQSTSINCEVAENAFTGSNYLISQQLPCTRKETKTASN